MNMKKLIPIRIEIRVGSDEHKGEALLLMDLDVALFQGGTRVIRELTKLQTYTNQILEECVRLAKQSIKEEKQNREKIYKQIGQLLVELDTHAKQEGIKLVGLASAVKDKLAMYGIKTTQKFIKTLTSIETPK